MNWKEISLNKEPDLTWDEINDEKYYYSELLHGRLYLNDGIINEKNSHDREDGQLR